MNNVKPPFGVPVDASRGPAKQLHSGRHTYLLGVREDDIDIQDIAASLAKLCRYTGHTTEFYSVAQHCVIASYLVPGDDALWALMHDSAEAYIGDISSPLKAALESRAPGVLKKIETDILEVIARRFDLPWPMPDTIKTADKVMVSTEKRDLLISGALDWGPMPEPGKFQIHPLRWEHAEQSFLHRFHELFHQRIN